VRPAAVVLAICALAVTGCGKKVVIASGAEHTLTRFIAKKTPATAENASCPDGIEAEVGNTFDCTFDDQAGKHYVAHMRITEVDGSRVLFQINSELAR
jgi:uncharacterized protein DUF4333